MFSLSVSKMSSTNESIIKDLILQIYMKLPQSLMHPSKVLSNGNGKNNNSISQAVLEAAEAAGNGNTSEVDTISHFLLSALASTQHGRSWADQMKDFEAGARKMAATHPLLMLRNLPLLAAGMKGRTDFDFSFFRSRNHMTFYSMSLGKIFHVTKTRTAICQKLSIAQIIWRYCRAIRKGKKIYMKGSFIDIQFPWMSMNILN